MLDRTRAGHPNSTNRPTTRTRRLIATTATAFTALLLFTAPAHAATAPAEPPAPTQQTAAPTPATPQQATPATATPQPGPTEPPYDTQPPGVSAYLPADALIIILIITAIFILALRYGPALAATGIKALLRLFQNTPPAQ
ncbi:hypothetical protein [Streptomyces agglomeratus]|uniref:hypothetical protein n=1 Tax=Streptomyces agglomeratus TaxID=285458 RepID=UPI000854E9EE|nr:hypothetical protein [Streptomyces agglomeratus]OEJ36529.1 hypothetical protein BGK72_38175 [Streptomyces agglomeratus]